LLIAGDAEEFNNQTTYNQNLDILYMQAIVT